PPEQEPPPAEPAPVVEPEPEPIVVADLSTVMNYLELGEPDRALEMIGRLSEESPNSQVLARLLRQIEMPIDQLLPGPYRQIEVGPGESLSLIAARELGDPLMFYALARLNGIDVPSRIPVGTVLRIPELPDPPTAETPEANSIESPTRISTPEIESVAEYLARSGQVEQARHMLIGRLEDAATPESTHELLVGLTLERASQLRAEGAYDQATSVIDRALSVVDFPEPRARLRLARSATRSQMFVEAAQSLRERGELVPAYEMAINATRLDFASTDADQLVTELRQQVVDELHNQALLAWRDRNVDLAIRTWESLLAVVPGFEPASVYLERARRLRQRLGEP
ncbi:MAG: LysM peptidoglycan-binding domain-containing protein, partial [Wenzhouxiangellaceae bacterium]